MGIQLVLFNWWKRKGQIKTTVDVWNETSLFNQFGRNSKERNWTFMILEKCPQTKNQERIPSKVVADFVPSEMEFAIYWLTMVVNLSCWSWQLIFNGPANTEMGSWNTWSQRGGKKRNRDNRRYLSYWYDFLFSWRSIFILLPPKKKTEKKEFGLFFPPTFLNLFPRSFLHKSSAIKNGEHCLQRAGR